MPSPNTYPHSLRLLHWLMAIAIFGMIATGWYMADLPDEAANKYALYPWHKSFGVLLLIALPLRFILRLRGPIPPLPQVLKGWEISLSHLTHIGLYALMLGVPLSGYIMSGSYQGSHGIDFFGLNLPRIVPINDTLFGISHEAHELLAWIMATALLAHIGGALKHRWFDQQAADVLPRMGLPPRKS